MRVFTLFSGVECIGLGLARAGGEIVAHCEIDRFARQVLRRRFPDHPILEDVHDVDGSSVPPADLVAFGSPCQDWSVAGRGEGLGGERARLFKEGVRVADRAAAGGGPSWILFENTFSLVLDRRFRHDFADVLGEITGFRPDPPPRWRSAGVCIGPRRAAVWRVLDAQYFGVPQRRRRLVLVASPGGRPAVEVLFEPGCLPGNSPSRRGAGEISSAITSPRSGGGRLDDGEVRGRIVAGALTASGLARGRCDDNDAQSGRVVGALTRHLAHGADDNDACQGKIVFDNPPARTNRLLVVSGDSAASTPDLPCLRRGCGRGGETAVWGLDIEEDPSTAHDLGLPLSRSGAGVFDRTRPRRLTPRECERLQGLPDDWTRFGVTDDGKDVELSDSRRYALIGNGAVVPKFEWIGRRLAGAMEVIT